MRPQRQRRRKTGSSQVFDLLRVRPGQVSIECDARLTECRVPRGQISCRWVAHLATDWLARRWATPAVRLSLGAQPQTAAETFPTHKFSRRARRRPLLKIAHAPNSSTRGTRLPRAPTNLALLRPVRGPCRTSTETPRVHYKHKIRFFVKHYLRVEGVKSTREIWGNRNVSCDDSRLPLLLSTGISGGPPPSRFRQTSSQFLSPTPALPARHAIDGAPRSAPPAGLHVPDARTDSPARWGPAPRQTIPIRRSCSSGSIWPGRW